MSDEKSWEQAANDPEFKHEMKEIASAYDIDLCDACEGDLNAEPERVVCYTDSQIADHPYEQGPFQDGKCAVDGWHKFEHDLGRDLVVHGSCFLNHDDVLVRL